MFSKTLVKLVNEAIVPAITVLVTKILGVVLFAKLYSFSFRFTGKEIIFSSQDDFLRVSSYSSLLMFGVIILGLSWVVVKAHLLHKTHLEPTLAARLATLKFSRLADTSFEVYSKATVWLSLAWLATFAFAFEVYLGFVFSWLPLLALFVVVNATWFLVFDVEREIALDKLDKEEEVELLVE